LSDKIDRWVIANALEWLRARPLLAEKLHLCAINLSGQSLGNDDILQFILDQIDASKVPAEKLCFEVTETAAVADLLQANHFMTSLKERGCKFALDDFGSGFSSFAYLKKLPVDYLKIDGSFVRDIVTDSIDLAMVRSINEIGHLLGKQTIAEFVEDHAILEILEGLGVDYAQGFGIGRPLPLEQFPA
jgi:EAL domain-containing protein (putative c-di-GMP-specific phosphodiesterase class I)